MADFKDVDLVDEGALRADVAHARERYEAAQKEHTEAADALRTAGERLAAGLRGRFPREDELTYALGATCDGCGAPMAYQPDVRPNAWDCADVLLGRVGTPEDKALVFTNELGAKMPPPPPGKAVHTRLPFWCWSLKIDNARKTRDVATELPSDTKGAT